MRHDEEEVEGVTVSEYDALVDQRSRLRNLLQMVSSRSFVPLTAAGRTHRGSMNGTIELPRAIFDEIRDTLAETGNR
jgi:hypothetical protein